MRDGLQDERTVATDDKLTLFDALVAAGVRDLEMMSFVRPDRVPAMADADELAARTADREGTVERWALVLNDRGAQRAAAAGIRRLQFVVSVSDDPQPAQRGPFVRPGPRGARPHRRRGAGDRDRGRGHAGDGLRLPVRGRGRPPTTSLAALEQCSTWACVGAVSGRHHRHGGPGRGGRARAAADRPWPAPRPSASTSTTPAASGSPTRWRPSTPARHASTPASAGSAGARSRPGASGNVAMEDLVHVLEAEGIATGVDLDRLIEAAQLACALVGRPVGSHVGVAGPRFKATSRPAGP